MQGSAGIARRATDSLLQRRTSRRPASSSPTFARSRTGPARRSHCRTPSAKASRADRPAMRPALVRPARPYSDAAGVASDGRVREAYRLLRRERATVSLDALTNPDANAGDRPADD